MTAPIQPNPSIALVIFGASGHGRVVADAALAMGLLKIKASDRNPMRQAGYLIEGIELIAPEVIGTDAAIHVAIGHNHHREKEAIALGISRLATIVHPVASISRFATVGAGCFIGAQAVVAAGACIGAAVIVNHGAVIDHDCEVGNFSHIAPNASLGGGVRVGARVLVGAGAVLLPNTSVVDNCTIGAGSVLVQSISEPGIYAGVPARRIG